MFSNPHEILNVSNNATIDEIKKAYKKIALKCHPDKLNNITDPEEKKIKVKEFTEATNAYNQLLNNDYEELNYDNWEQTFDYIINSKLFKDFVNVLLKPSNKSIIHNFNLEITYNDYFSKNKKKIRIFLKDIIDPIFVDLDCKKFPKVVINHIDDNDIEHEIIFNLTLAASNNNNYYHRINNNNSIDIIHDMIITTAEYLTGNTREHVYLNKEILIIKIEPFSNKFIIEGLGINNGNFICNFIYVPIDKKDWNKLNDDDKKIIIRIFDKLKFI
jgi:hypothetical protein